MLYHLCKLLLTTIHQGGDRSHFFSSSFLFRLSPLSTLTKAYYGRLKRVSSTSWKLKPSLWHNNSSRFSVSDVYSCALFHASSVHDKAYIQGQRWRVNRAKQQICRSSLPTALNLFSSGNYIGRCVLLLCENGFYKKLKNRISERRKSGFLALVPSFGGCASFTTDRTN